MFKYKVTLSLFCMSVLLLTPSLHSQSTQTALAAVKKEIRTDGIAISLQKTTGFDELDQLKTFFERVHSRHLNEHTYAVIQLSELLNNTGLQDIDAYGHSVAKNGKLYDMDLFAHMKSGNENSFLWKMMGGKSVKLKTFDLLPENTILALTLRIDLLTLYDFIKKSLGKLTIDGVDEIQREIQQLEEEAARNEMPISKFVEAFSTEVTIFYTVNKKATMKLPGVPELPQMAVGIIVEQKSDFLANLLRKNVEGRFKPMTIGDFHTVNPNQQLPSGTTGGYAFNKEIGIISSDFNVIKNVIDIKNGKNLVSSEKFAKYKNISRSGNLAFYASNELSEIVSKTIKKLPLENKALGALFSETLFNTKSPEIFGVISKRANGLKIDTLSSFNFPGNLLINTFLTFIPGAAIMDKVEQKIRYDSYYKPRRQHQTYTRAQVEYMRRIGRMSEIDMANAPSHGSKFKKTRVVTEGLVAHWRLDETSGGTAIDSSGNGHTATYKNSPRPSSKVVKSGLANYRSLDLETTRGQYLDCGTLNLSGKAISYACWIKVESFQLRSPYIQNIGGIESSSRAGGQAVLLRLGDAELAKNNLQFSFLDTSGKSRKLNGTMPLSAGTWYLVPCRSNLRWHHYEVICQWPPRPQYDFFKVHI